MSLQDVGDWTQIWLNLTLVIGASLACKLSTGCSWSSMTWPPVGFPLCVKSSAAFALLFLAFLYPEYVSCKLLVRLWAFIFECCCTESIILRLLQAKRAILPTRTFRMGRAAGCFSAWLDQFEDFQNFCGTHFTCYPVRNSCASFLPNKVEHQHFVFFDEIRAIWVLECSNMDSDGLKNIIIRRTWSLPELTWFLCPTIFQGTQPKRRRWGND